MKHVNIQGGQNTELLYLKVRGNYSSHWAVKGSYIFIRPRVPVYFNGYSTLTIISLFIRVLVTVSNL
jgi:hypothetical protein